MTFYDKFDTQIQGEENNPVSDAQYNQVMMLMATDAPQDFEGPADWSMSLEVEPVQDWLNGYSNCEVCPTVGGNGLP